MKTSERSMTIPQLGVNYITIPHHGNKEYIQN